MENLHRCSVRTKKHRQRGNDWRVNKRGNGGHKVCVRGGGGEAKNYGVLLGIYENVTFACMVTY